MSTPRGGGRPALEEGRRAVVIAPLKATRGHVAALARWRRELRRRAGRGARVSAAAGHREALEVAATLLPFVEGWRPWADLVPCQECGRALPAGRTRDTYRPCVCQGVAGE